MLGPPRILVLVLLLAAATPPVAHAQTGTPADTPATASDLGNLTRRIDLLHGLLQNQTHLLSALSTSLAAQEVVLRGLNATYASRLDELGAALARAALQGLNQTQHTEGLAGAVEELVRAQNATLAAQRVQFEATNASLQQAILGFASIRVEVQKRFAELDRNMTNDHVRLYEGVYITDPADPYHKKPAHVALLAGERTLAENQVVAHNETRAQYDSLTTALASSIQAQALLTQGFHAHDQKTQETGSTVGEIGGKTTWTRNLLVLLVVLVAAPLVYLFGPEVVQRIRLQRARIPLQPPPPDPDGLPSTEELDAYRAQLHEDPTEAGPAAAPRPRRTFHVHAPGVE